MFIDITFKITKQLALETQNKKKEMMLDHLGTHFDIMNKEFPLDYAKRNAILFDVSHVGNGEITETDFDFSKVNENMFICFYTGFIEKEGYGTPNYRLDHPQLTNTLIEKLVAKKISIIALDFAGIRHDPEHTPKDQYCADHGVFVVENLCGLKKLLGNQKEVTFTAFTFPMNFDGVTGLPCRVIAQID